MTEFQIIVLVIAVGVLLLFCAIPVAIAWGRKHPDLRTIAKLSPLALLSFALWIALIVWAATDKRNDSVVSRYIEKVRERNLGPWIVGGLVLFGVATGAFSLMYQ
ncbi:superinfection immunity protein [Aurantiacibacter marinus]|uniref:Uncharacterized protein n=1 Tax=Aurantiacibacter marinus TaxID=874156 RepID=A0A0H0XLF6_9SPHN|nr:superinfection immunity protein [Aurantiacibacter marinus]KLI63199.1 hypothetical protein AAV99_11005 [Aurantiacibacter marinus]